MGDLGAVLRMQRQWNEAERYIRVSLPLRAALAGEENPWFASGLDNLARVLIGQWRLSEALPITERAHAVRLRTLGDADPRTEESRLLAESVRGLVANWRRLSDWSLALLGGGLLAVLASAWIGVAVERKGKVPGAGPLWLAVGGGASFGIATGLAGALLLAQYFPETPGAAQIGKAGYFVGQFGGMLIAAGVANALRRRAGLPRRPLWAPAQQTPTSSPAPAPADVRAAIRRGVMAVVVSSAVMLFLSLAAVIALGLALEASGVKLSIPPAIIGLVLTVPILGFPLTVSWLAWSAAAPRWRVWAMARVADLDALEAAAVRAYILHDRTTAIGRWATRTEWWTAPLRVRARQLRAGRGHPSWSGDA
jgi:hypothetical protein